MDIKATEETRRNLGVFCCYAREDQSLLQELKKHLMPLQRDGLITLWADTDINAGSEWEKEVHLHLNTAAIILLLVSPDFIASEYCYSVEMKQAMERHEQGAACVIPIILRPVSWERAPFKKLQVLPTNTNPVTGGKWHNQDEAFYDVTEGIYAVVENWKLCASAPTLETSKESSHSSVYTQDTEALSSINAGKQVQDLSLQPLRDLRQSIEEQERQVFSTGSARLETIVDEFELLEREKKSKFVQEQIFTQNDILSILNAFKVTGNFYIYPNIPEKIISKANRICNVPRNEQILGLIDCSIFGAGKSYILFGTEHIYSVWGSRSFNSRFWYPYYPLNKFSYAALPEINFTLEKVFVPELVTHKLGPVTESYYLTIVTDNKDIQIRTTGSEVSPEDLIKIFDRFRELVINHQC